ncbi:MAG: DNA polymerase III subunit gamma/tau [Candidatus Omnitrophica bacterium]|nr:DNA polymerase III subunit gamma/tau [Candidatus Omnitrophota bacterium]
MSYVIFARKFRPQTFEDVVGQEPITTTLKNAIRQGRIPQSFLFSGSRGVGKTSTARILAKALNCAKGPTEKPCGECTACMEITQGNSLDVLEIDGASNRGIEEIRNLRETVKFKPVTGRSKIYIIDEVHMLTPEAFNALLKTLEEPPPHVKFVFATTEPHKVPMTILSRCQRFHFKRIPATEITRKLEVIVKHEKLSCPKNVLFLIAKASEGSLRDAESLLDQLASFAEGEITEEDVLSMLGLVSEDVLIEAIDALRERNVQKIFSIVRELYDAGKDLVQFARQLFEIFRHLLLFHCWPTDGRTTSADRPEDYVEISEAIIADLKKKARDFSRSELLLALSILGNLQSQLRRNIAPPRLMVETVLLKLLHMDGLRSIEDLVTQEGNSQTAKNPDLPMTGSRLQNLSSPPSPVKETTPIFNKSPQSRAGSSSSPVQSSLKASYAVQDQAKPSTDESVMTIDEVESVWPQVIEYVKSKRMSTGIFLSEAQPVEVNDATVVLGLPAEFQFHKDTLEKVVNRRLVEEALESVSGKKIHAQFVIIRLEETQNKTESSEPKKDESRLPDIISQAMDIFKGAKIIRREQ